nr:reverse transcriptase domain-containing protein [Tanacetum cinerariifolium]
MADQRTMEELLCAPAEGYAEAIVVPLILAEQFELKHSFINMMTSDQFFGLEKDNPHDYICCGNLLERLTQDVLTIIENKAKVCNSRNKSVVSQVKSCEANSNSSSEIAKLTHAVNQQMSVVTTAMTAILKQFQATPPPASVKAVEEICVTCDGAHPYYQCLAAGGNTFPELRDNIQGYVSAAAVNYNQGNAIYHPPGMANQIRPPSFAQPNVQNNQNWFSQPQVYNRGKNFNQEQSYQAPTQQNQIVPLNELEKVQRMNEANMKAMQTQINIVKNELRNEMKILIQAFLSNQTNEIKNMMASLFQMNFAFTLGSGSLPSNTVANPKGELKAITTRSGLVLNGPTVPTPPPFINPKEDERVEETLTDPDLSEYTIKVPPPPVGLPELISTRMTLELANRAICTPAGIARDVFVLVGNFTFPADFVIVDYKSDPRDIDSSLKDSIDQSNLANPSDNFVDSMPEMFTDEHAPDYSSPPIFDKYDDDLFEVESDTENVYDDSFDSKGEKIKESKLLIDELDLPCDFLPSEYDSFISQDFSRVDSLSSTNNEDKIFNPGILIQENPFEMVTRVVQDKKLATSNASLIFLFSCGKDIHILGVPCRHFYPLDQFKYGGIGSS